MSRKFDFDEATRTSQLLLRRPSDTSVKNLNAVAEREAVLTAYYGMSLEEMFYAFKVDVISVLRNWRANP